MNTRTLPNNLWRILVSSVGACQPTSTVSSVRLRKWIVIPICLCFTLSSSGANRFWVGSILSNWNNVSNWSTTTGGASGASVPGSTDIAIFDVGGAGNCSIDVSVSVAAITVAAGYAGTISQNAHTIFINGLATFSGGAFTGGSANVTVVGTFTLSGTIFSSTSAVLELRGDAVFTSASFTHNNGNVIFDGNSSQIISGISPTFYRLGFVGKSNTYTLLSAGNVTVLNALVTLGSSFYNLATGTIDVKGDIDSGNTAAGCGGDAMININGTGTQNFNGAGIGGEGALPGLTINKLSGTLHLTGFPAVSNNFTYIAGALNPGTSTFCFTHGNATTYTISGSVALGNVEFYVNIGLFIAIIPVATTITVTGNLILAGAGGLVLNTGNINVSGNLSLVNTAITGGGSASINMIGTASQNIDGTAISANQSRLPVLTINKANGTLGLLGNISFAGNVVYTAGTINAGTSTCYVENNIAITGSFPVNNFTLTGATNTTLTIASGTTLTVTGTLNLEGSDYITLNTGTIAVHGNLVDNNTSTIGGGTATILFNGTGAQTITSTGVMHQGILPAVTINKLSGTLTFPSLITARSNWTYVAGTLDLTTHNSTVVFANTLTITGNHALNNITLDAPSADVITIASGTTITVSGNMTLTGIGSLTINTGTLNLLGNLNLLNTGISGGGTGVIAFTGTSGNQAIISTLAINQSNLPSVRINKASGTLTLPAFVTVQGNWIYTSGTLDVTTNNSTVVFNNSLSITGSHTLNHVVFEGILNNSYTISTGTLLTVAGTLITSGTSFVQINTPIIGATAILAHGDININNTSSGSGGTGTILINGTGSQNLMGNAGLAQGSLPYVKIQKSAGVLSFSGTISTNRDWSYLSGTVDAGASTVAFGGNNLTISSNGMSFNDLSIISNTCTLINDITVKGNLSISGTAVLAGGANNITLGGNWTNWGQGGFTESTGSLRFNGSGLQTIATTGGGNFNNLIVDNSGIGIRLLNNVSAASTLNMSQGNIDLNTNTFTLGLSAASNGTLSHLAGAMINTGSFVRWFKPTTVGSGSASGLFPVGTSADYRPFYVSAPVTGPASGGTVALSYNDASTNSIVSIPDGGFTVVVRKDFNWSLVTGSGFAGGTFEVQSQGTGFGTIGAIADLRLTQAASAVGTAGNNTGSESNPQIYRAGLTAANLSNSFYVGSVNGISTPLPITLVFFTATRENQKVKLKWATSSEKDNAYYIVERSTDTSVWTGLQQITGAGNTSTDSYYSTHDHSPFGGNNYYRLKQVDRDGRFTYSPVRLVILDHLVTIHIYPNPAKTFVTIHFGAGNGVKVAVAIVNSVGQIIEVPNTYSGSKVILNTSGLSKGVYFIRLTQGQKTVLERLIVE